MVDRSREINQKHNAWRCYSLRWRFDFFDRRSRVGRWNDVGATMKDHAWAVRKDGLTRVVIEGLNRFTGVIETLAELVGQDHVAINWDVYTRVAMGSGEATENGKKLNGGAHVAGVAIVGRYERITVWVNGAVERRPLTAEEKSVKIYEHTAGGHR